MKNVNGNIAITGCAVAMNDEKLFIAEAYCNAIFSYDLITKRVELLTRLTSEKELGEYLVGAMGVINNMLIIAPRTAEKLHVVNLKNGLSRAFEIPYPNAKFESIYNNEYKFLSLQIADNKVYLLGGSYPGVLLLDLETMSITILDDWVDRCRQYLSKDFLFFRDSLKVEDVIYAPFCGSKSILKIDMKTEHIDIVNLSTEEGGYASVCLHKDLFWFLPRRSGPIEIRDKDFINVTYIDEFPQNFVWGQPSFSKCVSWEDCFYAFPIASNAIVSIENSDNAIRVVSFTRNAYAECHNNHMVCYSIEKSCFSIDGGENEYIYMDDKQKKIYFNMMLTRNENDILSHNIYYETCNGALSYFLKELI